jgi:hypothetical protein
MRRRNGNWMPEPNKAYESKALIFVYDSEDAVLLDGTDAVQFEMKEVGSKDTDDHDVGKLVHALDEESAESELYAWEGTITYDQEDEGPTWRGKLRRAVAADFEWPDIA